MIKGRGGGASHHAAEGSAQYMANGGAAHHAAQEGASRGRGEAHIIRHMVEPRTTHRTALAAVHGTHLVHIAQEPPPRDMFRTCDPFCGWLSDICAQS